MAAKFQLLQVVAPRFVRPSRRCRSQAYAFTPTLADDRRTQRHDL